MTAIGYHASHEQFEPDELLDHVRQAEQRGFDAVLAADHFHPWSERQGSSGFVWSWLGSAMEVTDLPFGIINAPGYHYHPAVVAQAVATLERMYPDRFRLSVGNGELLNEHVTGEKLPAKPDRNARLRESVAVMRRLWDGETTTHDSHVTVEEATLYTRTERSPPVVGAALSEETAAWLAKWADGLITVATSDLSFVRGVVEAFREEAPDKPVPLKAQLADGEDEEAVIEGIYDQWRTNSVPGPVTENLRTTEQFDAAAEQATREQVRENIPVSAGLDEHVEWLRSLCDLDVEAIYLHDVTRDQIRFVDRFGDHVLPALP